MAVKMQNLDIEIAHFNHFKNRISGYKSLCKKTIQSLLELGLIEVSTAFEHALAMTGGHTVVSMDKGDLYRDGAYSDAKISTVRTINSGKAYSASVANIYNKTGTLRVQVYERKQNKFYYFAIPRRAYIDIPKSSNIEIPFELDGSPRRRPSRKKLYPNWWTYEIKNWEEMATKN